MVIEKFTFVRPSKTMQNHFLFYLQFFTKIFYKWNLRGVNIVNSWNSSEISEEFQRFHLFQSLSSNYAWLQWNSTGIPPDWWKDFLVGLSDLWLPFLKFFILSAIFHSCSFASSNVASLFFILLTKPIWLLILEIWVYLSNSYLYL